MLLHACCQAKEGYLQGQIGNPEGEEARSRRQGHDDVFHLFQDPLKSHLCTTCNNIV